MAAGESGKRDQVLIATKVGMLPGEGGEKLAPARIAAACEASLERLGTDRIDLYFAHQDDDAVAAGRRCSRRSASWSTPARSASLGASNFHAARLKSAIDSRARRRPAALSRAPARI